jgi:hypothetical protein
MQMVAHSFATVDVHIQWWLFSWLAVKGLGNKIGL